MGKSPVFKQREIDSRDLNMIAIVLIKKTGRDAYERIRVHGLEILQFHHVPKRGVLGFGPK